MTPELKAALREIALSHSQGMYMHNPDGEFVPVNAEALAVQLEGEIQPEIERLVAEAEDRARFELTYRLLLGAGGELFVPKNMLEVPLTDYEITTYQSPIESMPGVVYKLTQQPPKVGKEK